MSSLDEAQLAADLFKARVKAALLGRPSPAIALGHFELLGLLGRGSTGAVFEARDTRSGADVAVKVLRDPEADSVARFKSEFRGLSGLVHENLVQLHELFVEGATWYFSMELVRGEPFTSYVRQGGESERCDLERLRLSLAQLLFAVHAVHEAGWLHCDLKPSNVLVTGAGRVVVLDFGLLTATADLSALRAAGETFGTPAFMAPELDAGDAPSAASDAYAVGVMLFLALTGKLPYPNAGTALARSRRPEPAPRVRDLDSGAPTDLDALCAALLERDPRARMGIAEALTAFPHAATPHAGLVRGPRARLVGRDAELSDLRAAWGRVASGQMEAVFVRGRSGIGKTALLESFAAELASRTLLLVGRCHERESVPYKAFDAVVDSLATAIAAMPKHVRQALAPPGTPALLRIFPQLKRCLPLPDGEDERLPRSPHEQRQAAFGAFKELMRRLTAGRSVALIVDDLQWADLDSARLLLELLGPPATPALLYLGSYRDEEELHSEFLRELRGLAGSDGVTATLTWITLGPLSEQASIELATALLPAQAARGADLAERAARESGGVPFVLAELVAHALEAPHDGRAAVSVTEMLTSKLTALTDSERRALSLLSVAARPLPRELLERALGAPDAAARALRRLAVGGLLQHDANGSLVVYHDRLREHVTERLSTSDGATLHRELAQAYERTPSAEQEWLIEHWRAAGEPERAIESAVQAAAAAAGKLAFNRAAGMYRTALALLSAGDVRAAELHESLGETLINAGRGAEAAAAFLAAAERSNPDLALLLRCRAAQQQLRCGRNEDAILVVEDAFDEVGLRYPRSKLALYGGLVRSRARIALRERLPRATRASSTPNTSRRLAVLSSVFREFAVYDPLRSALFHGWFYEDALRTGDHESVFIGLAWDTYQRAFLAGARQSRRMRADLHKLDSLAAELATPYARGTAAMMRGIAAMFAGAYREAAEYTGRALREFREGCPGSTWEESLCAIAYYAMIENTGPLATVCDDAPRMVRLADERVDQFTDGLLGAYMASTLLAQDRPVEAEAFLRGRLSRLAASMDGRHLGLLWRIVDTQLYMADGTAAFHTIESMWPSYLASGYDRSALFRLYAHKRRAHAAIMAHRERRDPALLDIARREAAEVARSRRQDGLTLSATICAALAHERGDYAAARTQLSSAIELCGRLGATVAESCMRLALGRVTDGAEGRALVEQAETSLRAQGVTCPARWSYFYAGNFER